MRAASRIRSLRTVLAREGTSRYKDFTRDVVPHLITSFVMLGRGITTLAFSCERTKMNSDHTMMRGAFVCCNGLLGGGA
jgi:hypothetical protein